MLKAKLDYVRANMYEDVCVKIIQANLVSAISESGVYVCFWPGPKVECAAEAVAR